MKRAITKQALTEEAAVFAMADRVFDNLLQADTQGLDGDYVLYVTWCLITRYLTTLGWTTEELLRDVGHHAADQETEGRA